MTNVDRENDDFGDADGSDHRPSAATGHEIVVAFTSSPLAGVSFDRFTLKSKVRDIRL